MSELEDKIEKENMIEFERQVERLGYFTHNGLSTQAERIAELENLLYGLINTLAVDGNLNQQKLQKIAEAVKKESINTNTQFSAGISIRIDKKDADIHQSQPVNCAERMHICKAVCCRLDFALSTDELEGGKVKWDLGTPYRIRQNQDGYCTHIKKDNMCCGIYDDRPKVCSRYSCAGDKRIWTDFEKMELNDAWISENLKEKSIKFLSVPMVPE